MPSRKIAGPRKRLMSFKLDQESHHLLIASLNKQGVAERAKSRWLCAAVQVYIAAEPHLATVGKGEGLMTFPRVGQLLMDEATELALDEAIRRARINPGFDHRAGGLKASIIRAAIRHIANELAISPNAKNVSIGKPAGAFPSPKKRMTLFRLDADLKQTLADLLTRNGVRERSKSRWLCGAIRAYLVVDSPRFDWVSIGEGTTQFTLTERIVLDRDTDEALDVAIRVLRLTDYRDERLQGKIIRAAIRYASRTDTVDVAGDGQSTPPAAPKPQSMTNRSRRGMGMPTRSGVATQERGIGGDAGT